MAAAGLLAVGSPAFAQNRRTARRRAVEEERSTGDDREHAHRRAPTVSTVAGAALAFDRSGSGWTTPRRWRQVRAGSPCRLQRWSSPVGSGIDAPVFDVLGGVVSRVHAFASMPVFPHVVHRAALERRARDPVSRWQVRDACPGGQGDRPCDQSGDRESSAPRRSWTLGYSRVNAVLPLNAEWRHDRTRVYGSTGRVHAGRLLPGWRRGADAHRSARRHRGAEPGVGDSTATRWPRRFGLRTQSHRPERKPRLDRRRRS